ncbi:hypothetical protein [Nitrosospira sp. Nsp13]|uniref:hypothetical protein n=1 Tax=Nitrosospira sp. Nsp13 TaxID=1855332 RepID=UPI00088CA030|nr:hypothetical protein [Nitrosospira sp. Nsp13]SCX77994.1 hypothetical protein SAMN05216308_101161 [Nitrosospira sp. Nsp13]
MNDTYTTQKLLTLRKLTRTTGEIIDGQMKAYVATLTPLFRQRAVFGEYIQASGKETVKGAEQAFKELQSLYESIATVAPFHLSRELNSPLMQMTSSLELTPWEYIHTAAKDGESRTITVTCPFKSIITYTGYSPRRLRELLTNRNRNDGELQQFVLHYLAMHVVVSKQPGLAQILNTLHFPLASSQLPDFGALPITYITSSISTSLPPDGLVIESTELSGKNAFEELINVGDIENLGDPFKHRLMGTLKASQQ